MDKIKGILHMPCGMLQYPLEIPVSQNSKYTLGERLPWQHIGQQAANCSLSTKISHGFLIFHLKARILPCAGANSLFNCISTPNPGSKWSANWSHKHNWMGSKWHTQSSVTHCGERDQNWHFTILMKMYLEHFPHIFKYPQTQRNFIWNIWKCMQHFLSQKSTETFQIIFNLSFCLCISVNTLEVVYIFPLATLYLQVQFIFILFKFYF